MTADHAPIIALVTCPKEDAERIARALVGARLAACVNSVPEVASVYRWEGEVEEATESLLVIKTVRFRLPEIESRLAEIHPYDTFELIATEITGGAADYLGWIAAETRG